MYRFEKFEWWLSWRRWWLGADWDPRNVEVWSLGIHVGPLGLRWTWERYL